MHRAFAIAARCRRRCKPQHQAMSGCVSRGRLQEDGPETSRLQHGFRCVKHECRKRAVCRHLIVSVRKAERAGLSERQLRAGSTICKLHPLARSANYLCCGAALWSRLSLQVHHPITDDRQDCGRSCRPAQDFKCPLCFQWLCFLHRRGIVWASPVKGKNTL